MTNMTPELIAQFARLQEEVMWQSVRDYQKDNHAQALVNNERKRNQGLLSDYNQLVDEYNDLREQYLALQKRHNQSIDYSNQVTTLNQELSDQYARITDDFKALKNKNTQLEIELVRMTRSSFWFYIELHWTRLEIQHQLEKDDEGLKLIEKAEESFRGVVNKLTSGSLDDFKTNEELVSLRKIMYDIYQDKPQHDESKDDDLSARLGI